MTSTTPSSGDTVSSDATQPQKPAKMKDKAIGPSLSSSSSSSQRDSTLPNHNINHNNNNNISLDLNLGQDPILPNHPYLSKSNGNPGLTVNGPIEVDNEAASLANETRKRFPCKTCQKTFPTSQALGGHQNAHKLQRELTKQREQMKTLAPSTYPPPYEPYHLQFQGYRYPGNHGRSPLLGMRAESMIQKPHGFGGFLHSHRLGHGGQWSTSPMLAAQRNVCCYQPHNNFVHRTHNNFNMHGIGTSSSSSSSSFIPVILNSGYPQEGGRIAGGSVRVDWGAGSPSYPYTQNYPSSSANMARGETSRPQKKNESSQKDDDELDLSLKL